MVERPIDLERETERERMRERERERAGERIFSESWEFSCSQMVGMSPLEAVSEHSV